MTSNVKWSRLVLNNLLVAPFNNMGLDRFTFNVTLQNEQENEALNRRGVEQLVCSVDAHPKDNLVLCCTNVCGGVVGVLAQSPSTDASRVSAG